MRTVFKWLGWVLVLAMGVGQQAGAQTASTFDGQVFINEIMINPVASDCGTNNNNGEWTELYNAGPTNVNIGCWTLYDGDWRVQIPTGTILNAGDYYVIGSNSSVYGASNATVTPDLNISTCGCTANTPGASGSTGGTIGCYTNGGEQALLIDNTGGIVDHVDWGGGAGGYAPSNSLPLPSCGANPSLTVTLPVNNAGENISSGGNGCSYARQTDGSTTWEQRCNLSFPLAITPGASNAPCPVNITAQSATDSNCTAAGTVTATFTAPATNTIELYNTATPATPVQTLTNQTSPVTFTGLATGTYNVRVEESATCFDVSSNVTVAVGTDPTLASGTPLSVTTEPSCVGANGVLTVATPTGGLAPYEFEFRTVTPSAAVQAFSTTATFSTAAAATAYEVVIRDDNGCTQTTNTVTPATPSLAIALNAASVTDTNCQTSPSLVLDVTGDIGTGTPAITLDPQFGVAPSEVKNGASVTYTSANTANFDLEAGTYQASVSLGTCNATLVPNITVNAIADPTLATGAPLSVTTDPSCVGANGVLTVATPTGGTSPYEFEFRTVTPSAAVQAFSTTATFSTAAAATAYEAIIRDDNGCTQTTNTVTTATPSLAIALNAASVTDTNCQTSPSLVLDITGDIGTGTPAITLDPQFGVAPSEVKNGATVTYTSANTANFDLEAGTYQASVSLGTCNATLVPNIAVNAIADPSFNISAAPTDSNCTNDGQLVVSYSGTVGPAFVEIERFPLPGTALTQTAASPVTFSSVSPGWQTGTYRVRVQDGTCVDSTGGTGPADPVVSAIADPDLYPSTGTQLSETTAPTCAGDDAALATTVPTLGTTPFTYTFYDSTNQTAVQTLTTTTYSTADFATEYIVFVEDANGCRDTSNLLTVSDLPPFNALTSVVATDSNCVQDGSILVTAINLTPTPPGISPNQITIEENGTVVFTSLTPTGIPPFAILDPGTYRVRYTFGQCVDSTGGTGLADAVISTTPDPSLFGAGQTWTLITETACDGTGGALDAQVPTEAAATAPFQYTLLDLTNASTDGPQTAQRFTGLNTLTDYAIAVEDANGCRDTTGTEQLPAPTLDPVVTPQDIICSTLGEVSIATNEGGPIQFDFVRGATAFSTTDAGSSPFQISGSDFTPTQNFTEATYTVTLTKDQCVDTRTFDIQDLSYTLNADLSIESNSGCAGANDGILLATLTGATPAGQETPPYFYTLSNGDSFSNIAATTQRFENLSAATYSVVITDNNGCTGTSPDVTASATVLQEESCDGQNDAAVEVNPANGLPGYTFSTSSAGPFTADSVFTGLSDGPQTFFVQDACNDIAQASITLQPGPQIDVSFNFTPEEVYIPNGIASFFNTSSANVQAFSWDFGTGNAADTSNRENPEFAYTDAGTYTVTLTGRDGACEADTTQEVNVVIANLLLPNVFSPNGDGLNDTWLISNSAYRGIDLQVYDRWGVQVFSESVNGSAPVQLAWDGASDSGSDVPEGVFIYAVEIELASGQKITRTGSVTVIR